MTSRILTCAVAALAIAALAPVATAQSAGRGGGPVLIGSLPCTIDEGGSYALAGNLSGNRGIVINASRVTLDLRGFSLTGRDDSGDGIFVRGNRSDIEIHGGTVSGWAGVAIQADSAFNSSFHDLRLSASGLCGLRAGHGAVIADVAAQNNGGAGIQGAEALVISDCTSAGNAAWGFELGAGSSLQGCAALHNGGGGVFTAGGALVRGNAVYGNGWQPAAAWASGCGASTLAGIAVLGEGARIDGNTVCDNTIGLQLLSGGSSVSDNMVSGNEINYQFEPGNQLELMLCELPQTISWPAKVTLAGTLTGLSGQDGIVVDADGVTIDMLDHGLIGVPGSLTGIRVLAGRSTVHVMDGFVRQWGQSGVTTEGAFDCRLLELSAESNGQDGLNVGEASSVIDCTAYSNGRDGLKTGQDCMVKGLTSNDNGNDGVQLGPHSTISGSTASENLHFGIRAEPGGNVSQCTASKNTMGIAVTRGCAVQSCTASFNSMIGIRADAECLILSNLCDGNANGIVVLDGPGTRVEGNNLSNSQIGLTLAAPGNLAIRNSSWADVVAYSFDPASAFGPVVDLSAGGAIATESPWANFRH
ncbi:MAG TPA: right-handed parallel beta-helix repeat-containing protein [Planctomycetota bacterium]|nr:right-handed parallel beta-helix repeat-containing protein [Planctomycetota bacterium]